MHDKKKLTSFFGRIPKKKYAAKHQFSNHPSKKCKTDSAEGRYAAKQVGAVTAPRWHAFLYYTWKSHFPLTCNGCQRCSQHRCVGYPDRKQHEIVKFDTGKRDGPSRLNFPAVASEIFATRAPTFDCRWGGVRGTENRCRRSGPGWRAPTGVPIQQTWVFSGEFRRCTAIVYVIGMSLAIGMVYTAYQR